MIDQAVNFYLTWFFCPEHKATPARIEQTRHLMPPMTASAHMAKLSALIDTWNKITTYVLVSTYFIVQLKQYRTQLMSLPLQC